MGNDQTRQMSERRIAAKVVTQSQKQNFADVLNRLAGAQKSATGAPAYSRFVNRRLGRLLAAGAFQLGLTPNVVTIVSGLFSFAGIAVLATVSPSWTSGVVVSLALIVGYALDSADGQLARLRGGGSHSGEWLDHMIDAAKISALHLAILIGAYRFWDLNSPAWLLVPIGFTLVAAVTFFGMILNDLLRARRLASTGVAIERTAPSTLRSLLVIPTDYGFLCLSFLLLGATNVFFGLYVVLFVLNAGFLALAAVKWFRDMSRLDLPTN